MRPLLPIFFPGETSPEPPDRPGIALGPVRWRGPRSAWLHGALTVTREEARAGARPWLRALFATAIAEPSGTPQVASLCGRGAPLRAPALAGDGPLRTLAFHVDLCAVLPAPLPAEAVWAHVSARERCSTPLRIAPDLRVDPGFAKEPVDLLVVAYGLLRDGDPAAAVPRFAAALEEDALRHDLDAAHLYNAACAAARAADRGGGVTLAARALAWLGEDLRRRAARVGWLEVELASPSLDPTRRAELLAAREAQAAHLAALKDDADLEPLRELEGWPALFEVPE